jgi:hypothetical protein
MEAFQALGIIVNKLSQYFLLSRQIFPSSHLPIICLMPHSDSTCSTRVECLTGKMDIENHFDRSHEARYGMHDHQKMN